MFTEIAVWTMIIPKCPLEPSVLMDILGLFSWLREPSFKRKRLRPPSITASISYCWPCALRASGNWEKDDNNAGKRCLTIVEKLTAKWRLSNSVCDIFLYSFYDDFWWKIIQNICKKNVIFLCYSKNYCCICTGKNNSRKAWLSQLPCGFNFYKMKGHCS